MIKFTTYFGLPLEQPELDFVNISLDSDLSVYVDPFAISFYDDPLVANAMMRSLHSFRPQVPRLKAR